MVHELWEAQKFREVLNRHIEHLEKYQHLLVQLEHHINGHETLVFHDDQGNSWTFYRSHSHNDYVVEKNQEMIVAVDDLTIALLVLVLQAGDWHP